MTETKVSRQNTKLVIPCNSTMILQECSSWIAKHW